MISSKKEYRIGICVFKFGKFVAQANYVKNLTDKECSAEFIKLVKKYSGDCGVEYLACSKGKDQRVYHAGTNTVILDIQEVK